MCNCASVEILNVQVLSIYPKWANPQHVGLDVAGFGEIILVALQLRNKSRFSNSVQKILFASITVFLISYGSSGAKDQRFLC